ncbi:MAG: hypothetical protein LW853_03485 [Rickettsiales bacterium]|jgi:hypothetical protein|nr:hypothetical protein [Rickettsiales bacterium]
MPKPLFFPLLATLLLAAQALTPAAAAQSRGDLATDLDACSQQKADAQRLACFDALASRVIGQVRSGVLTIVDREQVKAVRREAFGFSVPALTGLFAGGEKTEVESVETTIARIYRTANRGWGLRLADGSRWEQTDQEVLPRDPKPGDPVVIQRAALGSYLMKVNGMAAFRAKREE